MEDWWEENAHFIVHRTGEPSRAYRLDASIVAEVWLHDQSTKKAIGLQIVLTAIDRKTGTTKEEAIDKSEDLLKQFVRDNEERVRHISEDEHWVMDWRGTVIRSPAGK